MRWEAISRLRSIHPPMIFFSGKEKLQRVAKLSTFIFLATSISVWGGGGFEWTAMITVKEGSCLSLGEKTSTGESWARAWLLVL